MRYKHNANLRIYANAANICKIFISIIRIN